MTFVDELTLIDGVLLKQQRVVVPKAMRPKMLTDPQKIFGNRKMQTTV